MAPLQIILLLILIRVPGLSDSPTLTHWLGGQPTSAGWVFSSFVFAHLLLIIYVAGRARGAVRQMHRPSTSATSVMTRMDRLLSMARWATLAITAVHIYGLGAGVLLREGLDHTHILKHIPLINEATLLAPALIAWVCFWASYYAVEAAQRQRQLPYRLGQKLPAHEMPPLGRYLSMQVRHNYYLLLPLGVASLLEKAGELLEPRYPGAMQIAGPLTLGAVFLAIPWLITRIWATTPLRGPLRTKLDAMARQHRLRFRNILIWKTHNAITNAAILGFLPFSRYFLMTDALLETLTDRQIEAVFAHEVGHGVHKHIWWYLGSMVAVFMVASGLMGVGQVTLGARHPWIAGDAAQAVVALVIAGGFLMFVFPKISHRFEHQADWFAARQMAEEVAKQPEEQPIPAAAITVEVPADGAEDVVPFFPPEPLTLDQYLAGHYSHSSESEGPERIGGGAGRGMLMGMKEAPAVMGAELFVSALDTIIELAHKSRNKAGWMHPSVNGRIALIRDLAVSKPAAARFERQMWWTRAAIAGVFAAGLALTSWATLMQRQAAHGTAAQRTAMLGR